MQSPSLRPSQSWSRTYTSFLFVQLFFKRRLQWNCKTGKRIDAKEENYRIHAKVLRQLMNAPVYRRHWSNTSRITDMNTLYPFGAVPGVLFSSATQTATDHLHKRNDWIDRRIIESLVFPMKLLLVSQIIINHLAAVYTVKYRKITSIV